MPEPSHRRWIAIAALLAVAATAARAGQSEALPLTGRVVDRDGKPIPGVRIWRFRAPEEGLAFQPPPVAITRSDGTFSLSRTAPFFSLGACPPGWLYEGKQLLGFPPFLPVFELRLRPATRVSGRVIDSSGAPVAGVVVWAAHEGRGGGCIRQAVPPPCASPDEGRVETTDGDGRFVFESMKPGWIEIRVAGPAEDEMLVLRRRGEPGRGIEGVEFVLARKAVPVEGRVVDANGAPVAGAEVVLSGARPEGSVETDEEGRFLLPAVLSGSNHLLVEHPDHGQIEKDIEIGEAPPRLDLQMPPVTLVHGRIVGPENAPLQQVFLREGERYIEVAADGSFQLIVPAGEHEIVGESYEPQATVRELFTARGEPIDLALRLARYGKVRIGATGSSPGDEIWFRLKEDLDQGEGRTLDLHVDHGQYEIDVPAGEWTLLADDATGRTFERRIVVHEGETTTAEALDFLLLPPVRGRVLDPAGRPLGFRPVTFWHDDLEVIGATDLAGRFAQRLPAGRWRVRAEHQGFGPATATVELSGDAPVELPDLRLVRLVAVSGRILGVPPEVVVPWIEAEGQDGSTRSEVDPENRFHNPDLWPGTWTLTADIDGRPVSATLEIPPDATEVHFDLETP
jgi:protocatechuate 3,4-dioxygenase beta subunit